MDKNKNLQIINLIYLFTTLIFCFISVSILLQTKDEFRFIIPYVEFSKQIKGAKPLVLDTSVIIDGRIADICDTGIIDTKMIVPRFVLQELQGIADSSDKIKRNRGRRGLDILKRMQTNPQMSNCKCTKAIWRNCATCKRWMNAWWCWQKCWAHAS